MIIQQVERLPDEHDHRLFRAPADKTFFFDGRSFTWLNDGGSSLSVQHRRR